MKPQLLPYSCVGHPVGQSCTAALVGGSLELLTELSTFVIHMVELLHVDRLLYVGYYEPKDDRAGNRERCEAFFTHYSPGKKACIRAWDYNDDGPASI